MTKRRQRPSAWAENEHGVTCWTHHDECAIKAAVNLVDVQIYVAEGRRERFRTALRWRNDKDTWTDAVALARRTLGSSYERDWKVEEAHP